MGSVEGSGVPVLYIGRRVPKGPYRAYEDVSKILRTTAAIYTAVVVARDTGRW
jgi:hypothetical protein